MTMSMSRAYKTVLSYSVPKLHAQASLSRRGHTQRRSPNFLSTVSYSDLTAERPNLEYAQVKTVLNAVLRQTKMAADVEIGRFRCKSSSFWTRCAVRFQRPSRLRGVVDPFEEVV